MMWENVLRKCRSMWREPLQYEHSQGCQFCLPVVAATLDAFLRRILVRPLNVFSAFFVLSIRSSSFPLTALKSFPLVELNRQEDLSLLAVRSPLGSRILTAHLPALLLSSIDWPASAVNFNIGMSMKKRFSNFMDYDYFVLSVMKDADCKVANAQQMLMPPFK